MEKIIDHNCEEVYELLYRWTADQSFIGFDPYDALNTEIALFKKYRSLRLLLTYFNKFSLLNCRKVLRIKAHKNSKALALICKAVMHHPLEIDTDQILKKHIDYFLSKSLRSDYGYHCWNANNFALQTRKEYQLATMPGIIGTEVCASAIFEYYKKHPKQSELKSILFSVRDFFLKKLLIQTDKYTFFKYKPISPKYECVYNASLVAASYIARIHSYFNIQDLDNVCKESYQYVVSNQNSDGSWYYGIDLRNHKEKKQIDFHQGYILDAIWDYLTLVEQDSQFIEAYRKGLEFYMEKQFDSNGQSYYRYPRKYPIDIHNQAQGIITFSKAGALDTKYFKFAETIARWTVQNLRNDSGYFYYQKYPFITNKIAYMRWGQAWMLYALSHLLSSEYYG